MAGLMKSSAAAKIPTPRIGVVVQHARDSARRATTLNTSRRIAALLALMRNQYAAKDRRVLGSVARMRVSVLNRVPDWRRTSFAQYFCANEHK